MVDRHHQAHFHQGSDQIIGLDTHTLGQFTNGDGLGDLDDTLDRLRNRNFGLSAIRSAIFFPSFSLAGAESWLKNPLAFLDNFNLLESIFLLAGSSNLFRCPVHINDRCFFAFSAFFSIFDRRGWVPVEQRQVFPSRQP